VVRVAPRVRELAVADAPSAATVVAAVAVVVGLVAEVAVQALGGVVVVVDRVLRPRAA
jgi:hypothetical protein